MKTYYYTQDNFYADSVHDFWNRFLSGMTGITIIDKGIEYHDEWIQFQADENVVPLIEFLRDSDMGDVLDDEDDFDVWVADHRI